jgi:hypothetical protein
MQPIKIKKKLENLEKNVNVFLQTQYLNLMDKGFTVFKEGQ